jgi:alcohol dehydrogenase class IV
MMSRTTFKKMDRSATMTQGPPLSAPVGELGKALSDIPHFSNPTSLFFGRDVQRLVSDALRTTNLNPKSILVVTGTKAAEAYGFKSELVVALPRSAEVHSFSGIPSDPPIGRINDCIRLLDNARVDLIVAIGGGSTIDFAKASACLKETPLDVETALRQSNDQIRPRKIPLFAIPTTAGTGTEATPYAVLRAPDNKRLFAISHHFFPTIGIVCTKFFQTVPPRVAAEVAIDGFTHALEAIWSRRATPISDAMALQALALFHRWLRAYYEAPSNTEAAEHIAHASTLAGLSFANAFTTICHALSFPLAETLGLSHGKCCGLTAAQVAEFNAPITGPAVDQMCGVLGIRNSAALPDYIRRLRADLGDQDTLVSFGIDETWFDALIADADARMIRNNSRSASTEVLRGILKNGVRY